MKTSIFFLFILGVVPERGRGQRGDGRGPAGPEHPLGRQLLGVAPEEALAERQVLVHQEHHGTPAETLLIIERVDWIITCRL